MTVGFNTTNGSDITNGTVTFTGEDFVAGTLSTQSRIYANTTLYGGVLELKDNAAYGMQTSATSFTVNADAKLQSTAQTSNVVNKINAGTITFKDGATVESNGSGTLSLNANTIALGTSVGDIATFQINASDSLKLQGQLSGSGILQKTGDGTLTASSNNQFSNIGGLSLKKGAVDASNYAQTITTLDTEQGTTFKMGSVASNLYITQGGNIKGVIDNVNILTKTGAGALTFNTSATLGSMNLNQGRIEIGSGKTVTVNNAGAMQTGTLLGVHINSNPALKADTFTTNNASIDITGYNPIADQNVYTIVQTDNGVNSTNLQTLIAGQPLSTYVTLDRFIIGSAQVDNSAKNIVAQLGLVWRNTSVQSAHGTFEINADQQFDLGVDLANNTDTFTYAYGWDGQSLTKTGAGILMLNGQNTYTGITDIQQGTLIVGSTAANANAQISGEVQAQKGSILSGHGKILNHISINNGATLAPGSSTQGGTIGNLTVASAEFNAGSTLQIGVNPDSTGDQLIADSTLNPTLTGTGTVTIHNGSNLNIHAGAGKWSDSISYVLVDTDKGVNGTFTNVISNLAFLVPAVDYTNANQIKLTFIRNNQKLEDLDGTYNERQTGGGIDSLGPGSDVYDQIVSMSKEQALKSFDNLSGEIHASAKNAILLNSRYSRDAVNQHLSNVREVSNTELDTRKNLWVSTWFHDGHIKNDGNAARLNNNGWGFLIGTDAYTNETTTIGVAAGYEETNLHTGSGRDSDADIKAAHLLAYARTQAGFIDIKGAFGYSWLDVDTTRNIAIGTLTSRNTANYDGNLIQAYIEGSHTFTPNANLTVTPYVNLAYQRVHTGGFTEKGDHGQLHGGSSSNDLFTSQVGARGEMQWTDQVTLYADLGWAHHYGSIVSSSKMNMIGGNTFHIKGASLSRDDVVVKFGAQFQLTPKTTLSAGYEGMFGQRDRDHAARIRLQVKF